MGKRGTSSSTSTENEEGSDNKVQKVDNRKIYSLMMQEPGYRNGGTKVMFQLFKTLEGAKAGKTDWVSAWGDGYYDFSGDSAKEGEEDEEVLPKYDHDSLEFEGDCGGDFIYCLIEEIDLDSPDSKDGSFFFASMNA